MQQKSFGKLPSGERLVRIEKSPNYKEGTFRNLEATPMMAEGVSYPKMLYEFFFKEVAGQVPDAALPSIQTDLKTVSSDKSLIIWFGHSSYLIKINGKNILVDPVFSERTSPVQYAGSKRFEGTGVYTIDDFPDIDVVIITHDHYDHLDYNSILQLKSKAKLFCTSLGVGSHLAYWGIDEKSIVEFDWWDTQTILPGIDLTAAPARHFSGRGFTRFKTLWSSFILKTADAKIFIGGDSGYDSTFRTIGQKFGPFDIALLECGQYDVKWPYIHMLPEQTAQAAVDLRTNVLMPVHWGKFKLANHAWRDPIERVSIRASELQLRITTPRIGETVEIGGNYPVSVWWQ